MLLLLEGALMCFILLVTCVIGIANGPVGLVVLYESDVQNRAIELGLTTKKRIRKSFIVSSIAMSFPALTVAPAMVCLINGANDFWSIFWQTTVVLWIMGLFDRFFIDWYWVGKTKTWIIPGTEDLMPYIPPKVAVGKWIGTIVGFPLMSALSSAVICFLF